MANSMSEYRQNGVDYIIDDPTVAPVFVDNMDYPAGQHVKHEGNLYRFKVNHPAGAWNASHVEQVTVVEEIASQKAAVEAEAAARQSAIANLNRAFSDTKSAMIPNTESLKGITHTDNLISLLACENGSYDSSGQPTSSTTRVRSVIFDTAPYEEIYISCGSGYKLAVERFDADGSFIGEYGFSTNERYILKTSMDAKFAFLFANTGNTNISLSDLSNFTIKATYAIGNGENKNTKSIETIAQNDGRMAIDFNNFVVGTLVLTSGVPSIDKRPSAAGRVSMVNPVYLRMNSLISLSSYVSERFGVFYSSDGVTYTDKGWKTGDYRCEEDGYYLIAISAVSTETYQDTVVPYVSLLKIYPKEAEETARDKITIDIVRNIEAGSISGNPIGVENRTAKRMKTQMAFAQKGSVLSVPYALHEFYIDVTIYGDTITQSGWCSEYYFENDSFFRLSIKKVSGEEFSSSDIAEFKTTVRFYSAPVNKYRELRIDNIRSVCHAGLEGAPENTIPALLEGFLAGFNTIECDARLTKDNIWVLCHDATINRTARNANGSSISETIYVADTNYEDLLQYDFGIWKGEKYAGTKIPKAEDAYRLCRDLNVDLYCDVGSYPTYTKAQIWDLMNLVNSCGMHNRTHYVCSTGYASYILEKDASANIAFTANANEWLRAYSCLTGENSVSLDAQYDTLTEERVNNAKAHNMPIEVYTIREVAQMDDIDDYNYITGVTSTIVVAQKYYENLTGANNLNTPAIVANRATSVTGGYMKKNGECKVSCNFISAYTANDSPQVLGHFPTPTSGAAVVMCMEVDTSTNAVKNIGGIINNTGLLILTEVTSGKKYYVEAVYS